MYSIYKLPIFAPRFHGHSNNVTDFNDIFLLTVKCIEKYVLSLLTLAGRNFLCIKLLNYTLVLPTYDYLLF